MTTPQEYAKSTVTERDNKELQERLTQTKQTLRQLEIALNRRVTVEQHLWDYALYRRDGITREEAKDWAILLGVPEQHTEKK